MPKKSPPVRTRAQDRRLADKLSERRIVVFPGYKCDAMIVHEYPGDEPGWIIDVYDTKSVYAVKCEVSREKLHDVMRTLPFPHPSRHSTFFELEPVQLWLTEDMARMCGARSLEVPTYRCLNAALQPGFVLGRSYFEADPDRPFLGTPADWDANDERERLFTEQPHSPGRRR